MNKTLRSLLGGLLLAGLWSVAPVRTAYAAASDDLTITVTPIADVSLILNTSTYAFGPLAVNASSASATALTLTNSGQVSVTVDKRIVAESDPIGWTASTSVGRDAYVLYCATSTTRLSLGSFTAATRFGAQNAISDLTGPGGAKPVLPTSGLGSSVDLRFRLDTPSEVSSSAARTITVRFTGLAE